MNNLPAAMLDHLRALVGDDQLLTDPADVWTYGYDNSRKHHAPAAVAFATTHDQVLEIARLCNTHQVPFVARGRGTGTAGAAIPTRGGLVVALERMDRILAVDAANRVMVVEPGVTNQAVQDAARAQGFFWPPDPTSAAFCTVGGNLAVNAGGPRAVKYGATRDNVLGLRAVTGGGDSIHTGVYTTKSVVGYDLTRLLIGSEGTLAIITEAILKLTPLPEAQRTLQVVYADIRDAAAAVSRIMAQPVTPCALEFMDAAAIDMIRGYAKVDLPDTAGAMLMIEVDGMAVAMPAAVTAIEHAAQGSGLVSFRAAGTADEARELWAVRKALSPALRSVAPNKLNEDVVVPVSRIPALIDGLAGIGARHGIPIVNFGHAGNGNIHVNLMYDAQDPTQAANAKPAVRQVFELVIALGGTLSGEHGIGREKRDYMPMAVDAPTLALMQRIKAQFDARGLLNPDKVLASEPASPAR